MPYFLDFDADAPTSETRRVAERLAAVLCGQADGAGLFDHTKLWVQGDYWWSGDIDGAQAGKIQARFHACLQGGKDRLKHEVRSIIADGNRAAIEMVLSGIWHDDRAFRKDIHIAIDVAEGRIVNYREYGFDNSFFALERE